MIEWTKHCRIKCDGEGCDKILSALFPFTSEAEALDDARARQPRPVECGGKIYCQSCWLEKHRVEQFSFLKVRIAN